MTTRRKLWSAAAVIGAVIAVMGLAIGSALAQPEKSPAPEAAMTSGDAMVKSVIAISVAAVVGLSCLAAGIAVARVGSAALGAASERPELLGRSLIFVGLAEGIAIYGLIIGILLMRMVK